MRARPACFAALTDGILLLSPPVDARAQSADTTPADEIVSYDVTVRVLDDASFDVTEEIALRVTGGEMSRGLVWRFLTSLPRTGWLARKEIPFRLREVRRDGELERYFVRAVGGEIGKAGVRVAMGAWRIG